MLEKLICITFVALLWLYTFQAICVVVDDAKSTTHIYNIRIEQILEGDT